MRVEFYNWVLRTLDHPEDRLLDVGELCFALEQRSARPLEDVFFEFESEIDDWLTEAGLEIDQTTAIGYTQEVFGVEQFDSEQDMRLKMLELAVFHVLRTL